jgi:O-antigen chain-terminating methyltransferase
LKGWSAADVADTLPRPSPIPPPDHDQIERLNTLYELEGPPPTNGGWRQRLSFRLRRTLARILFRQQAFNAVVVEHLNRNTMVGVHIAQTVEWVDDVVTGAISACTAAVDELRRSREALLARERRSESAVASLSSSHEELRTAVGVLQQAAQNLKHEVARLTTVGVTVTSGASSAAAAPAQPSSQLDPMDSHKYVGFEDQFRGSAADIRQRVSEYLPLFLEAKDVLDVGCGRGEFLALLVEHGVPARGIDMNAAMVDVCRRQGFDASEADGLQYLRALPDGSLGGLFAAQVVEHLEPRYLAQLLDAAFDKLRPGSPIVLETINPACWFAFFESYIRDLTHVRPIHPDTLKYLLIASGFQNVEIRYRAPYPEHEKLQRLPSPTSAESAVAEWTETLNANVEKINRLLFTWLDYAAIGRRP